VKPETRFRDNVHRHLPPLSEFHRQSMNSAAATFNGTPDMYYDGAAQDLWAEYKWIDKVPRSGIIIGEYTELQLRWMRRRWKAGRNVWGIVGTPDGGFIQTDPVSWASGTASSGMLRTKDIARRIEEYCNGTG